MAVKTVAQAFDAVTVRELIAATGRPYSTCEAWKKKRRLPSGRYRGTCLDALRTLTGWRLRDDPPVSTNGHAVANSVEAKRLADIRKRELEIAKLERENDEAAGLLVPLTEMEERHRAAATEMRRGLEAMRRDMGAVVPEEAADAVLASFESGADRLRKRVARALAGGEA